MTKKEQEKFFKDNWEKKYPKGEKALVKALKKASKVGLFEVEEKREINIKCNH